MFKCTKYSSIVRSRKNIFSVIRTHKTGYKDVDSNFVNSNFKSVIDWNTYRQISNDTVYVKVKLLDRVEVLWYTLRIDIKDNDWIRAISKDKKWDYKLLTFIKEDNLAP